jgi:hypothetical protein
MSERQEYEPVPTRTFPVKEWTSPEEREAAEKHFGIALGEFGHEFGPDSYSALLSFDQLGAGIAQEFSRQEGLDPTSGYQVRYTANYDNGKFSGGYLLLGGPSRQHVAQIQEFFVGQLNHNLKGLQSPLRLAAPNNQ